MIWTLGDTAAKWLLTSAGVALAMFWRGVFGAMTVTVVAWTAPGVSVARMLRPTRPGLVAVRSAMSSFVSVTWYIAWEHMSLIDTYAIGFTAPLIMTVLAVPMLGERLRWRRTTATVVGFLGVLVMLRPDGDLWHPAVLLLLAGIVAMSFTRIMTRQLSVTETPECQAFWLLISHLLAGLATLWAFPPAGPITGLIWAGLVFLGISSGLAHCVYTRACGLAPIGALAPYEYLMLPLGGAAGYFVFQEVPSLTTLVGAAIIVAAGLYNLHRERDRYRRRG